MQSVTKTALPPRQEEVLVALYRLAERNGFVPSIRELGLEVGLSSSSSLHYHLIGLSRNGLIQWQKGRNRAIQITDRGRAYLEVKLDKPKVAELRPVCTHCGGTGLAY